MNAVYCGIFPSLWCLFGACSNEVWRQKAKSADHTNLIHHGWRVLVEALWAPPPPYLLIMFPRLPHLNTARWQCTSAQQISGISKVCLSGESSVNDLQERSTISARWKFGLSKGEKNEFPLANAVKNILQKPQNTHTRGGKNSRPHEKSSWHEGLWVCSLTGAVNNRNQNRRYPQMYICDSATLPRYRARGALSRRENVQYIKTLWDHLIPHL